MILYDYWEEYVGEQGVGAGITTVNLRVGGADSDKVQIPVLRPFTTYLAAMRMQRTSSDVIEEWILTLFKNGSSAATLTLSGGWGTSPSVNQTFGSWSVPVTFARGDNLYLRMTGLAVSDPRVIGVFDCWQLHQMAGAPSA